MIRIALLSDNHSFGSKELDEHLANVDEIWHAGDIGALDSIKDMRAMATFRGVYGNIDTLDVREIFPLDNIWECGGLKIYMTHIGGYPGKYKSRAKSIILKEKPNIFISGHSHICKVMPDRKLNLLHMNPGAYGHYGFHKIRTMLKFDIDNKKVVNMRAIELGYRGAVAHRKYLEEE